MSNLMQVLTENAGFAGVCVVVIAAIILVSRLVETGVLKEKVADVGKTRYITLCAMFGAIAMVLHILDFAIPFLAPGFYKLDFSEVPVMIGAFLLGPVGGVVIEVVKILLKLVVKGTSTAFVGDLANFVVGCSFVVPASIMYHLNKTKKTALLSLITGTVCMTIFGSLFNGIYLIPAFAALYGMPVDVIIQMGTEVNGAIHSIWTLVLFSVVPLNILKGVLISVVTALLYKRISTVLHNMGQTR